MEMAESLTFFGLGSCFFKEDRVVVGGGLCISIITFLFISFFKGWGRDGGLEFQCCGWGLGLGLKVEIQEAFVTRDGIS